VSREARVRLEEAMPNQSKPDLMTQIDRIVENAEYVTRYHLKLPQRVLQLDPHITPSEIDEILERLDR
jgi:hypothetical protein